MQDLKLTPTSYIVLGLLDAAAPAEATPYDLKRTMALSVDNFWSTPHAQVYREPERLATGGFVTERREETGRRRRFYAITDRGRAALEVWRGEEPDDVIEMRVPGVLKLFFGADPVVVAENQIPILEAKLTEFRTLRADVLAVAHPGQLRALDLGIAFYEAMLVTWRATAVKES